MRIVLQIIRTTNNAAMANNVRSVKKLTIEIGEASAIVPRYVDMFWKDVLIRSVPARDMIITWCRCARNAGRQISRS